MFVRLQAILEVAEDMEIDIPHIWLYLAELITPMLHEGGISMGDLFRLVQASLCGRAGWKGRKRLTRSDLSVSREICKPLIPQGKAGVLLVHILTLLCKGMVRS